VSGRRRSSGSDEDSGERRKKLLTWLGWGVLVALLGGNLLITWIREPKNDKPQGVLTPEILLTAAFWVPICCALTMSALGLYWSSKAYSQNERSSLLWARRGYVFGLIGSVVLMLACYDNETFPRERFIPIAAMIVAGQALLFGMMSFKEFRRAQSGGGGGRRGRSSEPTAATPSIEATPPAASTDASK
jgi:hypothetical protein